MKPLKLVLGGVALVVLIPAQAWAVARWVNDNLGEHVSEVIWGGNR